MTSMNTVKAHSKSFKPDSVCHFCLLSAETFGLTKLLSSLTFKAKCPMLPASLLHAKKTDNVVLSNRTKAPIFFQNLAQYIHYTPISC